MSIEIKVPVLGESVVEATVAKWMKTTGEAVNADEPIVELETDKVSLEVPAPKTGVLTDIIAKEGDTVEVDAILAILQEGAVTSSSPKQDAKSQPECIRTAQNHIQPNQNHAHGWPECTQTISNDVMARQNGALACIQTIQNGAPRP